MLILGALACLSLGFARAYFLPPVSMGDHAHFTAEVMTLDTPIRLDSGSFRGRVRIKANGQVLQMYAEEFWGERQILAVTGEVRQPRPPLNPGELDFAAVLERQGVAGLLFARSVQTKALLRPTLLSRVRFAMARNIEQLENGPSGLALALALGDRRGLTRAEEDAWRKAGVNHVLSVSGMHVAILAGALYLCLRKVAGFQTSLLGAALFAILYALLLGGVLSAWRAALSFALGAVAKVMLRDTEPINILALVAAAMLLSMPLGAADPGFILSFAATAGLLLLTPSLLAWLPAPKLVKAIVATSLAAQLATAPVVLAFFHAWPLYGLPANLALVPLSSLLVGGAFIIGVFGALPGVGDALVWFFNHLAGFTSLLVNTIADLPFASYHLLSLPVFAILLYYVGLTALPWVRERWGRAGVSLAVVSACTLLVLPTVLYPKDTTITFLAVGNADAIHLAIHGRHYFIDAATREAASRVVVPYLRSQGINTVRAVMITHTHADHVGGLGPLAAAVDVDRVYIGPDGASDFTHAKPLNGSFRMQIGRTSLTAWQSQDSTGDLNHRSVVLWFTEGNFRALFAADIGLPAEQQLRPHLEPVHVLKVAHHGSRTSTGAEFLRATSPLVAVVTVGPNRYGHPDPSVVARLDAVQAMVKRTDAGAIRIRVRPTTYHVYVYRYGRWQRVRTYALRNLAEGPTIQTAIVGLCPLWH
ncbi:MAG: ComE operon protein 3 [Firmicutes bacterium]|nr:ComE operon protein 3 [candidate division NPL-UPA2 bacterium]